MTNCELICGDCCEVMESRRAESFDACITSPPYNLGIRYKKYKDKKSEDDYIEWALKWIDSIYRMLNQNGSFFLNFSGASTRPWLPHELVCAIRKQQLFQLQNTFHWIKAISINEKTSHGHFKPINSERFVTDCHEFVFHFTKTGKVPLDRLALGVEYTDKSNVKRWKHTAGRDSRCRGNTWFIPYETIQKHSDRPHPAPFPVALAEFCIKVSRAKSVLDPFAGIGSSGLAAQNCCIDRYLGIDIDQECLDHAKWRMNKNDRLL
jgi:site-specific DNA-methyltransferase (adenine-specific)